MSKTKASGGTRGVRKEASVWRRRKEALIPEQFTALRAKVSVRRYISEVHKRGGRSSGTDKVVWLVFVVAGPRLDHSPRCSQRAYETLAALTHLLQSLWSAARIE
jgi:hypothetical protein